MTRPRIISLGEVLWDLFPEGPRFGGAPANFACHASILGADVSMVSAVGDDDRGREAIKILSGYGIDVSLIQITPEAPTGTVGIELDSKSKPTFTIHENSAWDRLVWETAMEPKITGADAIYFGTLGQRSETARETIHRCLELARKASIPRIVDINLRAPFFDAELIRQSLRLASILKLSDDELPHVCRALDMNPSDPPEEVLKQIVDSQTLDLVVLTRGEQGAVLIGENTLVRQPGIETVVRDTVGAGDSFTAAFLVGLLYDQPHEQILQNACQLAAKVCAHVGAVPDEVHRSSSDGE